MKLLEPKTVTFKPIWIILIILFILLISSNGYQWNNNKNAREALKTGYKNKIEKGIEIHKQDSILIDNQLIFIKSLEKEKDSFKKSEQLYKNRSFANYKKYKNAKITYNNSNRSIRDSLAIALARE